MKKRGFRLLGYLVSVFPPLISTLLCFPVLYAERRGAEAVSLGVILLVLLSLLPFLRRLRELLRTPSAPLIWGILLFVFYLVRRIADEVVFISLAGFLGSMLGAVFFRLGGLSRGGDAR